MKESYVFLSAILGVVFQHLFGAWDRLLEAMIVFMLIDVITGVIVAIMKKSPKTSDGSLWSGAMRAGLIKKGWGLFFVVIAVELDALTGSDYIRSATIFCILMQELLSIAENSALIGVPLPAILKKTLTVLNEKTENTVVDKITHDKKEDEK